MRLLTVLLAYLTFNLAAADDEVEASTYNVIDSVLERCLLKDEMDVCLQEEAASALGKALEADSIPLAAGLSLTKSPGQDDAAEIIDSGRSEPANAYDKIWENLDKLVTSRSLTLRLTDLTEGRGKKKKVWAYFGVALATAAAILIPLKLKFIGWMAASAFMIGKVALVIASIVGLKKLVSKPHEETTHVHYDSHRSDNAHYLAYSGQQPNTIE
ncbi:uncharacterized protein LOC106665604 [Cimex lectularius]|uniref:Osiris n=1 Tax=Cimex lectularius TaxID=79782 RepID=A0A8I6RLV2_CIMLE|nr:uncharacterized protein LOC106665604 [Cimex lectularius]